MKRTTIFLFLLCQLVSAGLFAQHVRVQKSLLAPKETGIYHANQAAALNTKTGSTLVIWQKLTSTESVILGRLVNAQGIAVGSQIPISVTPAVAHPSVAYNPARNEFMVGYDNNPNVELKKTAVFLRRLNAQGRPADAEMKLSTDTVSVDMANFFPKVVFNPRTNAYSVVWLREITDTGQADDGNNGMVGALVTSTGALGGPVAVIQKTIIEQTRLWGPITLDVAYLPANRKLLIAFAQIASGTSGAQADYFLATLDGAFNGITASNIVKINNAPLALSASFTWGARLALFRDTPGFVFYADTGNVKRRRIDLQGRLSGVSFVAFKPPQNNARMLYPSVAFATNPKGTRGLLVATQDAFRDTGEASVWAQLLDAKGLPVGAPVRVDRTTTTDTALYGILTALPQKLTDSLFRFTAYYSVVQFTNPGHTYQNSGIVKLNLQVTAP